MSSAIRHPQSTTRNLSRREFLELSALGLGGLALHPFTRALTDHASPIADHGSRLTFRAPSSSLPTFPQFDRLGRVGWYWADLKERPHYESKTVGKLYDDAVVPWLREVVGYRPGRNNQRYVETPGGYVWSAEIMPVRNLPNSPLKELPKAGEVQGMWVEVTVPWVNATLANPPARSQWIRYRQEHGLPPRMYYSQVLWVDQIKTDEQGQVFYRINERYGNPGDIFWAAAEAFRPLTAEELTPLSPEVEDKRIVVHANWNVQTLSCFEGNTEVYFCRISSGVLEGATPTTPRGSPGFPIWRKLYSLHMAGGTNADGWDLIGIAWTQLFVGEGVALHSTFWHNNFGEPMSHGCVNLRPQDAKWIFRWTQPAVPPDTGDITIAGKGSTRVIVVEV